MAASLDTYHRMTLLGTAELYDKTLSVFQRGLHLVSCARDGLHGRLEIFNQTIVAQPGSVAITNATDERPELPVRRKNLDPFTRVDPGQAEHPSGSEVRLVFVAPGLSGPARAIAARFASTRAISRSSTSKVRTSGAIKARSDSSIVAAPSRRSWSSHSWATATLAARARPRFVVDPQVRRARDEAASHAQSKPSM